MRFTIKREGVFVQNAQLKRIFLRDLSIEKISKKVYNKQTIL